ncbi:MAG: phosphatase PAP2 family protein [Spirochaetales bacterium]|nr:phosphatase PAP2 family protein [Spirochaetales bacterium]
MKKIKNIILIVLVLCGVVHAESLFQLEMKREILLGSLGVALLAPDFIFEPSISDPQERKDIFPMDEMFLYSYDDKLDSLSTLGAYGALLLPGLSVLADLHDNNKLLTYGVMYGEAFLLATGTKELLKLVVSRHRPYTYFGELPEGEEDDYYNSFPSGHTTYAFLGASFLSSTFSMDYPESRFKIPLIASSYLIAGGVGYLRIASGSHFLSDVLTGAVIGTVCGWMIPMLHLERENDRVLSIIPSGNGVLFTVKF